MRVALVHDWLVTHRGGEKVLENLLELYPQADIYTLFLDRKSLSPKLAAAKLFAPRWLQPFCKIRKLLLPVLPTCIESLDFKNYDLVISSSSCVAKGAVVDPDATHVCYIHSPMRYIWDQREHYIPAKLPFPLWWCAQRIASRMRIWDVTSAQRVTRFIANSQFVRRRVQTYYHREAAVAHPPVQDVFFQRPLKTERDKFFLIAGAWVPYKGFEFAMQTCLQAGIPLTVAGSGPLANRLKAMASGNSLICIEENPDQERWMSLMESAQGLLFPHVEDFGIICAESLALGTPVIALRQGGALDMVREGENGIFFADASTESLTSALKRFAGISWDRNTIRESARQFSQINFRATIKRLIDEAVQQRGEGRML